AYFAFRDSLLELLRRPRAILTARLPNTHQALFAEIRRSFPPGSRLFFEDRGRDAWRLPPPVNDPLGGLRIAPLVPLETGCETVGGPYLYTHLKTNFTQFGDGRFLGKVADPRRMRYFVDAYQIDGVVAWSSIALSIFLRENDSFEEVARVGAPSEQFIVFRVKPRPSTVHRGRAVVAARSNELRVTDAEPAAGELTLPYHWSPGWRSDPPLELFPHTIDEDPVPLIGVRRPPREFTLTFDPW
ncbi:MAG: hypothetical protein ACRDD1_13235, partial [Planctomycetia bacterium]